MRILCVFLFCAALSSSGQAFGEEGEQGSDEMLAVFRAPTAVAGASDFVLRDQFRKETDYQLPQQGVHVVFFADRHSGYDTVAWYLKLEKTFGDQLDYYGIGALDGVPGVFRPMVRPFLRRQVDKPILLDWGNEVCQAWGWVAETPNIFLVHPDGAIEVQITGKISDTAFEECVTILEGMLEKHPPVTATAASSEP